MHLDYAHKISVLPISLVIAILVSLGILHLGRQTCYFLYFIGAPKFISIVSFTLGITSLVFFLNVLMVFELAREPNLRILAFILILLGSFVFSKWMIGTLKRTKEYNLKNFSKIIFLGNFSFIDYQSIFSLSFCFLGIAIITMLPQSSDDSMNYHISAAINILSDGHLYDKPEWFLGRLAGSGEIVVALGLAVKSEHLLPMIHFSFLVQFLVMLAYCYNKKVTSWSVTVPFVFIISSPVLFMLFASAKPQFLPMMMSITAFWLLLNFFKQESYKTLYSTLVTTTISLFIVGVASQMKYNFILSYFMIALYICINFFSQKQNFRVKNLLLVPLLIFFVFVISAGPHLIFKFSAFGGDLYRLPVTLFNGGFPGYESFYHYVSRYDENSFLFPLSLLFPDRLGAISSTLGLMPIILILAPVRNLNENSKELLCIIIFFFLLTIFGSHTTRTFIEPFLWASILFQRKNSIKRFELGLITRVFSRITRQVIFILSTIMLLASSYMYLPTIFKSIKSLDYDKEFLRKNASGYQVFENVNAVLPRQSVLISENFAFVWSEQKVAPIDWIYFNRNGNQSIYKEITRSKKPTHALLEVNNDDSFYYIFLKSCLGDPILDFKATNAARNPFNRGKLTHYRIFKIENLSCLM